MGVREVPEGRPIRVIVVDSSALHSQLLAEGIQRVGKLQALSAATPADVFEAAAQDQIDVAVVSSTLDEPGRGFEVLRTLRSLHPDLPAVMLLESSKREVVVQAFRAGARGVLGRQASLADLCKCIRCVDDGQVWASAKEMLFVLDVLASAPEISALDYQGMSLLSERELEVVRSLAEGLTNREIGDRLGLSRHTVKNYLFRIFDKIGVSSRMELLHLTLRPSAPWRSSAPNPDLEKSPISEFEICRKEATEGSPEAQIVLAELYRKGQGTSQDSVASYMWCLLSEHTLVDLRERINKVKAQLQYSMNSVEILEAQQRASEWLERSRNQLFQNQNHEFQNHESQNHESQNHESQNRESQNHEFQNHESQNHESQNQEFQKDHCETIPLRRVGVQKESAKFSIA
ncbi:MAG TPA: response regulator transcription factor [Candidatus Sulfotelmatobacter sp.]|jgi:DNA-binding NarL/FixJ family response regulator